MFTGLVESTGTLLRLQPGERDTRLVIDAAGLAVEDIALGESVAVNGCCLTVVAHAGRELAFDVSRESLACTTLGELSPGDRVNLERALCLGDRLGGHLVSGHVDAVGEVHSCVAEGRSWRLRLGMPAALAPYVAAKGSVCVDGVSLTVNRVEGQSFEVQIIPHTFEATVIGGYRPGTRVNLEVDLIARYVERLLSAGAGGRGTG